MYQLYYKLNFDWKELLIPRYWLRLITRIASQSKYHHVDHNLPYKKDTISQAHSPVYRHIHYLEYFKSMGNVDVYAYKVLKKVDEKKLRKSEKRLVGSKYDTRGAISSESHGLIKQKTNDSDILCSEGEVIWMQDQGFIAPVKNTNSRSPQEVLELCIDKGVIDPLPIKIWDGKKKILLKNIFE